MSIPLGHERQISFFNNNGHNHDGENSTVVELQPGQVGLRHLDPSLLDYLRGEGDGGGGDSDDGLIPVPDLLIETNSIGPGASVTGTANWTGICVVRFMRIFMSADTECTITFYHKPTFAEEDREFRARRCANKFLWEGAWIHYDETENKQIHYKIENTGTTSARFQLRVKSGTLVANGYARFVESIQAMGSGVAGFIGNVLLEAGNGITIEPGSTSNSFKFTAVAPETITIDRYGLTPRKHVTYSSSTTTNSVGGGLNGGGTTSSYIGFGSGLQYVVADFGAIFLTGRVVVVPYPDGRVYNSVKIEGSADGVNWIQLLSADKGMGTITGLSAEIPRGIFMRYIRYWANGSSVDGNNHVASIILYSLSDKVGS